MAEFIFSKPRVFFTLKNKDFLFFKEMIVKFFLVYDVRKLVFFNLSCNSYESHYFSIFEFLTVCYNHLKNTKNVTGIKRYVLIYF